MDRRGGWPRSLPFTFVLLKVFLGSGQIAFPEGGWRETAFGLRLDKSHGSPKPFFFFRPRTMIAFLMRILFKKYALYFPPPPRIYFLLFPFPFFPSSELHVFLVMSHGWSAAWFFLLPVAAWQVADPAVDRELGGQRRAEGAGPGGRDELRQANVKPPQIGSGSSVPASPGYCSGFFSGGQPR